MLSMLLNGDLAIANMQLHFLLHNLPIKYKAHSQQTSATSSIRPQRSILVWVRSTVSYLKFQTGTPVAGMAISQPSRESLKIFVEIDRCPKTTKISK